MVYFGYSDGWNEVSPAAYGKTEVSESTNQNKEMYS